MHILGKICRLVGYYKSRHKEAGHQEEGYNTLFAVRYCLSLVLGFCLIAITLTACTGKSRVSDAATPVEAVQDTMDSLKNLDLKTLNAVTDNYVRTNRNWIGIPTGDEYRIFDELLQKRVARGERYKANRKLAKKMTENLSWKVKDVREDGDYAEIDMEITNKNMADVMGYYEVDMMKDMIRSTGTDTTYLPLLKQIIQNVSDSEDNTRRLISYIDKVEGSITLDVTVSAFQEDGGWKLHLDDGFINAFLGNMDSENYSEEIEEQLDELEDEYDEKMDQWGDEFGDRIEEWTERVFE